jgi:hypothetical protein
MGNFNDRIGWGVVGLAVVILFTVVNGNEHEPRFPNMLPEAELQRIAHAYIVPAIDGVIVKTESVVMSEIEWLKKIGATTLSMSHDKPIYLYRVYGDFKQLHRPGAYGDRYYAVDVALDATDGTVRGSSAYHDAAAIPDTRGYVPPVIPTVPPYSMPTKPRPEATDEIDQGA